MLLSSTDVTVCPAGIWPKRGYIAAEYGYVPAPAVLLTARPVANGEASTEPLAAAAALLARVANSHE
jgi:hypothetical protein